MAEEVKLDKGGKMQSENLPSFQDDADLTHCGSPSESIAVVTTNNNKSSEEKGSSKEVEISSAQEKGSSGSIEIKSSEVETTGTSDIEPHFKNNTKSGTEANKPEVVALTDRPNAQKDKTSTNPKSPSGTSTVQNAASALTSSDKQLSKTDNLHTADTQCQTNSATSDTPEFSSGEDYELIGGKYYYTDKTSDHRYMYDAEAGEWVSADTERDNTSAASEDQHVTTDSEGRTYYYAGNLYLCKDPQGNVFYWSDDNTWQPWTEKVTSGDRSGGEQENLKWYFYQGDSMFYRDNVSNRVYKLNKEKNEWEVYEGKLKKKRPRIDEEEEFDTDDEVDSDDEFGTGAAPPGVNSDPNINYDGTSYTKVDPSDNMVYEWDSTRRAWFPKIDEDFMAIYQLSYGFNPDGTKNENPLKFDDEKEEEEEAKRLEELEKKELMEKTKQTKKKPTWFEMDENQNTKVYVSNLPDSMTEQEFLALMQKCGLVLNDPATGKPKIKMYRDAEGNFKGDALCTYIRIESVDLALQILDDYQVGNKKISVEKAKFELKGEYNPKLKPRKKQKKELEKQQKRQQKLFDWRPEPMRGQRQKHENTVVIRNVFTPSEFEEDMKKILVHKEAMRSQCSNFGNIKKIEIHDLHSEGVVQVVFEEVESADMCVSTLNKRLYNSRILSVATWDGKEKFKIEETAAQRQERLEKWKKFLEGEEKKDANTVVDKIN